MKRKLLQSAMAVCVVLLFSTAAMAQKFGDNLGNHTATKDIQVNGHLLLNAAGVAVGTATITDSASIALQVDGAKKAILITRVTDTTAVATPVAGMIVYNIADNKFYVRNDVAWVSYSLALAAATDGVNTTSNSIGYTLTQVGQNTVLKLSPADATNPGIVSVNAQEFGGNKTFKANVATEGDLTVGTVGTPTNTTIHGITIINGITTINGATIVNNTLNVSATSTLNGTYDPLNPTTGGVIIDNMSDAENSTTVDERPVVIDAVTGVLKRSTQSVSALDKKTFPIVTVSSPFDAEGNSGAEVVITIDPVTDGFIIKQDDGIVVNFAAADYTDLKGLSILSAVATADNQVTVYIADLRNPADTTIFSTGYVAPVLAGKNLVITKYNKN